MTHPTEAAKAVEEIIDFTGDESLRSEGNYDNITAIIQVSNEAYAAARTRELVSGLQYLASLLERNAKDLRSGVGYADPNLQRERNASAGTSEFCASELRALLATHQPTKEA